MTPADLSLTHHFVDLPSLRMHYVEKGTGPLVLLLHGFPEFWWSWRYQIDALASAGFRVIAPDQRGYGETSKQGPYDLDTLTLDIAHLIESLGLKGKRVRMVGHDWGGAVGWHLASRRPQFVERLAVINCPHPAVMRRVLLTRPSWKQLKKSWYMFFFQLPFLPEYLLTKDDASAMVRAFKGMAVDRSHCSDEELRPYRDAVQRPGAASAMLGWYREAIRSSFRAGPPNYPPILCDTLLLWGKEDKALAMNVVVPGTAEFAPKVRVVPVEGAGHFVHSEKPEPINRELISFLNTSTGTS